MVFDSIVSSPREFGCDFFPSVSKTEVGSEERTFLGGGPRCFKDEWRKVIVPS